jgi:hypothetical protein
VGAVRVVAVPVVAIQAVAIQVVAIQVVMMGMRQKMSLQGRRRQMKVRMSNLL